MISSRREIDRADLVGAFAAKAKEELAAVEAAVGRARRANAESVEHAVRAGNPHCGEDGRRRRDAESPGNR